MKPFIPTAAELQSAMEKIGNPNYHYAPSAIHVPIYPPELNRMQSKDVSRVKHQVMPQSITLKRVEFITEDMEQEFHWVYEGPVLIAKINPFWNGSV